MKILCIGEALIDMICTDKGKSLVEGENFLKKPGGAPTNVAAAISALGGEVSLVAKVGTDPFGKHLVQVMESFGVATEWMLQDPNHFTTFAFVSLMENGERDFYFNRGADGELTLDEIEDLDLSEYSIVHFGSATAFLPGPLHHAYRGLLQRAKQRNLFVSFDPNYRKLLYHDKHPSFIAQAWDFLGAANFMKLSDEEAMLITGKNTLEEAAKLLQDKTEAIFAVTLGRDGTLLGNPSNTVVIPSIPVTPVDTTGAGDAFVGAVLYQLGRTDRGSLSSLSFSEWENIISQANKAGARTCEYMGAMEAFKHLNNQIFQ